MLKKVVFNLVLLCLFISCSNLNSNLASDIRFSLNEETANKIAKTVTTNDYLTPDTEIDVVCQMRNEKNYLFKDLNKTCLIEELPTIKIRFTEIPFDNYYISFKIILKDKGIVIYDAISDKILINENNNDVNLKLHIKKHYSKIEYVLNGGKFIDTDFPPYEYYLDKTCTLPIPEQTGSKFLGWFTNINLEGEPLTELGQNNFIGDVKLYAKWDLDDCTIEYITGTDATVQEKTVKYGDRLLKEYLPTNLTRTGYDFNCWNVDGRKCAVGDKVLGNLKLTASWLPVTYNIIYNNCTKLDSVTLPTNMITTYTIEDSEIDLTANNKKPTKPNFKFGGWYTDNVCTESNKSNIIQTGSSGELNLYPKWVEAIAPGEVTGLNGIPSDDLTSFDISWTNPGDEDFSKIIISCSNTSIQDIEITGQLKNQPCTKSITNLTKGNTYIFTVKTVDKNDNVSAGTKIVCSTKDRYAPKENPEITADRTVLFGDWPQSLKEDMVSVDDSKPTVPVHGWDCYVGSDNCYYVKQTVFTYAESNKNDVNYKTMPGESVSHEGEELYFKLEPIEWTIVADNYLGGKLLVCKNSLLTGKFNSKPNNVYADCSMRTTIKSKVDGIFAKAFSDNGKAKLLANTEIGTDDYIFIPTYEHTPENPPVTAYGYAVGIRWSWIMTRTPYVDSNNNLIKVKGGGNEQGAEANNGRICPGIILGN